MNAPQLSVLFPSLVSSIVLGIITLIFVFNGSIWPFFIPISLLIGVIGLMVASKGSNISECTKKARWKSAINSFYFSILVYIVASMITGSNEESGLMGIGLIVMFFFILPFYFGASQLLAILLIKEKSS